MNCVSCFEKGCLKGEKCLEVLSVINKEENIKRYTENEKNMELYTITTEIPKNIPRIEEVKMFIEKSRYKKIGMAFCKGMVPFMDKILSYLSNDLKCEFYPVICGNNGLKREDLGFEGDAVTCNPIGQGEVLNSFKTDLNVAIGLCVGHDILFSETSKAPITTLVVKDRVYKHNPLKVLEEN